MKADFKAILFERSYTNLSEKLRAELELKIVKVFLKSRFRHYVGQQAARFIDPDRNDFLCAYLLSNAPKDYVLSGQLLQGIRTWFNMYDHDRFSVIEKFRICYQNVLPLENINEKSEVPTVFCKFLISELLVILAESRWKNMVNDVTAHGQT